MIKLFSYFTKKDITNAVCCEQMNIIPVILKPKEINSDLVHLTKILVLVTQLLKPKILESLN